MGMDSGEPMVRTKRAKRTDPQGRAFAGSQLQMQLYVNRHRDLLDSAIKAASGVSGQLEWVSPIPEGYREYKDGAFLRVLGLTHLSDELRRFWPTSGPRWDGLARVIASDPATVLLIEAKNYPAEVRGPGCKASDKNEARQRIEKAFGQAKRDFDIPSTNDWMGSLYQYANRLAHVAFLRSNGVDAYMVNLCFYGELHRSRNTSEQAWRSAAVDIKKEIGFTGAAPTWLVDVFLPVMDKAEFLSATT